MRLGKNLTFSFSLRNLLTSRRRKWKALFTVKAAKNRIFLILLGSPENSSAAISYKLLASRVYLLNLPRVNTSSGTELSHGSYHRALSQAHTAPGTTARWDQVLCCASRYPLTLSSTVLCTHRSLQDSQSSWDLREKRVAARQHGLAQNGLGDQIKLFASTIWFYKMHVPRKHHFISICAPNQLPQPLLAENQNVSAANQWVLQDRHQQMLLLSAKGLSMNSAFTVIGSLNLPSASELAGMKSFFKKPARMNFHSSWSVHSSRFLEVLVGKTKHTVLASSITGNTGHNSARSEEGEMGHFLSIEYIMIYHIRIISLYQGYFPPCVDVKLLATSNGKTHGFSSCCIFMPKYPQR